MHAYTLAHIVPTEMCCLLDRETFNEQMYCFLHAFVFTFSSSICCWTIFKMKYFVLCYFMSPMLMLVLWCWACVWSAYQTEIKLASQVCIWHCLGTGKLLVHDFSTVAYPRQTYLLTFLLSISVCRVELILEPCRDLLLDNDNIDNSLC